MAKEPTTPEEKLLQLIDKPSPAHRGAFSRLRRPTRMWTAILAWWDKLKATQPDAKPVLTLRRTNLIVAGVCVVLTIVWLVDFRALRSEFMTRLETLERTQFTAPRETTGNAAAALDVAEILEATTQRNLFTFPPPKTVEAAPQAATEKLQTHLQELKLVGIIWSEHPQAIIEHTKETKTHLLSTGDVIGPLPIKVKRILKEKVILSPLEGAQEWELR